jgi:hypothetical protein
VVFKHWGQLSAFTFCYLIFDIIRFQSEMFACRYLPWPMTKSKLRAFEAHQVPPLLGFHVMLLVPSVGYQITLTLISSSEATW